MKRLSILILLTAVVMTSATGCGESASASSGTGANEPIVGLWQVTWTDATTHQVVLNVWDVWHADQTETENDTTPILLGNVCQGA